MHVKRSVYTIKIDITIIDLLTTVYNLIINNDRLQYDNL